MHRLKDRVVQFDTEFRRHLAVEETRYPRTVMQTTCQKITGKGDTIVVTTPFSEWNPFHP